MYLHLLLPATKLGQGYVFTGVCDSVHRGGRAWLKGGCVVVGGVHGYWGACVVAWGHAWLGGMCGCWGCAWLWGACMVTRGMHGCRGCAWLLGGVHGCRGACMVARGLGVWLLGGHAWLLGGMCGKGGHAWRKGVHGEERAYMVKGGCAWDTTRYGNTINERAVRILLECILVE